MRTMLSQEVSAWTGPCPPASMKPGQDYWSEAARGRMLRSVASTGPGDDHWGEEARGLMPPLLASAGSWRNHGLRRRVPAALKGNQKKRKACLRAGSYAIQSQGACCPNEHGVRIRALGGRPP